MKTVILLAISSVVLVGVSVSSNTVLAQTKIERVSVNSVIANGTGCPKGSVVGQISSTTPDGLPDKLSLLFKSFKAIQGKKISFKERRKNCNVVVNLNIPQGYQFSLFYGKKEGYANLSRGVQGVQGTTYAFPFTNTARFETVIDGPYRGNYQRQDDLGLESVVWSPCGKVVPLTLKTDVALKGNDNTLPASMTLNQKEYGIQWRQCPAQ